MLTLRFGVQVDMSDEAGLLDRLDQFGEPNGIISSSNSQIVASTTTGNTVTITGDLDDSTEETLFASTVTGIIFRDPWDALVFSITGIEDQTFDSIDSGSGDARLLDQIEAGMAIYGSPDHDVLLGDIGPDTVRGGSGDDALHGDAGNDVMTGGNGNDLLRGGSGNDTLGGENGNDTIYGEAGHDAIQGAAGNDTLYGAAGNDQVLADAGNDVLRGGAGKDLLRGGIGNDALKGDAGDDQLYGDNGMDTVSGGAGNDVVYGGAHRDTLTGDDGNDLVRGGGDNDILKGGAGTDDLRGEDGNDRLDGGAGNDILAGGAGADFFSFGAAGGIDKVMDFALGQDAILLSLAAFPELGLEGPLDAANFAANAGGRALDADDYIVYDTTGSKAGVLYYDPDGNGDDPAIRIAVITGAPALTHEDFEVLG